MRLILVRLSSLGDIIHSWPLAEALHQLPHPVELTWIVEQPFACLIEGHPAVQRVVTVDTRRWRRTPLAASTRHAVGELRAQLSALDPEVCLDSQGVLKSALITHMSGAARRLGFDRRWRRERLAGLAYTETVALGPDPGHASHRFLRLAQALGAPAKPPEPPDGRWLLPGPVEASSEATAVLLPGAGRPEKVLSGETLADVAMGLGAHGLQVLVAWGPGEHERAIAVATAARESAVVAPPTTILELASLLAQSHLVIGADTGPIHLAASLGVPTLAVHLATDPVRNGPLGRRCAVVSAVTSARGRGRRSAARRVRDVSSTEILASALDLLR